MITTKLAKIIQKFNSVLKQNHMFYKDIDIKSRSVGVDRIYIEFAKWADYDDEYESKKEQSISFLLKNKVFLFYISKTDLSLSAITLDKHKKGILLEHESAKNFTLAIYNFKNYSVGVSDKNQIVEDICKSIISNILERFKMKEGETDKLAIKFKNQIEKSALFLEAIDELIIKKQKKDLLLQISPIKPSTPNLSTENNAKRHKI